MPITVRLKSSAAPPYFSLTPLQNYDAIIKNVGDCGIPDGVKQSWYVRPSESPRQLAQYSDTPRRRQRPGAAGH
jgi:hypothetical protein